MNNNGWLRLVGAEQLLALTDVNANFEKTGICIPIENKIRWLSHNLHVSGDDSAKTNDDEPKEIIFSNGFSTTLGNIRELFPGWFDREVIFSDDSKSEINIDGIRYGTDQSLTTQIKNFLKPRLVNSSAIKSDLANLGTTKLKPKQHSFLLNIISPITDDDESESSD